MAERAAVLASQLRSPAGAREVRVWERLPQPPRPVPPPVVPEADGGAVLQRLVARNRAELDIMYDNGVFHNHVAQHLVSLFRLGAGAERLEEEYDRAVASIGSSPALRRALPPAGRVTDETWRGLIGAASRGEAESTSENFTDYVHFYRGKIAAIGEAAVLAMVFPHVVDGVGCGLFHPAIQLGCWADVGGAELLAEGLAWLSTACDSSLPALNSFPQYVDLQQAMDALRVDARLPAGVVPVAQVRREHARAVSEYDLSLPDAARAPMWGLVRHVSFVALDLFASAGCDSFFLAHLCTSARAMQLTIPLLADPEMQARYLRRWWQTALFIYTAQGRPKIRKGLGAGWVPAGLEDPPWAELTAAAAALSDSHLAKMVLLCRANHKEYGPTLYHTVAASLVARFRGGGSWRF